MVNGNSEPVKEVVTSAIGYLLGLILDGLKQNVWVNMIQVVWRTARVRNMCCAAARQGLTQDIPLIGSLQCPRDVVIMYSCFVAIIFLHLHINIVCCSGDSGSKD